jgi:hypothetical protein
MTGSRAARVAIFIDTMFALVDGYFAASSRSTYLASLHEFALCLTCKNQGVRVRCGAKYV